MADSEEQRVGKSTAAELLANWRVAERDRAAAVESAGVAALAAKAAERASHAARETADAARLSLEAAQRADRAARETAEAADVLTATASREQIELDAAVVDAEKAEDAAKDAFQDAQRQGFPKNTG